MDRLEQIKLIINEGAISPKDMVTTLQWLVDEMIELKKQLNSPEVQKIKYRKSYKVFIKKFNEITERSFNGDKTSERSFIARLRDGYTVKQMLYAVYAASKDDYLTGTSDRNTKYYLTPEYILRSDKLSQWLETFKTQHAFKLGVEVE